MTRYGWLAGRDGARLARYGELLAFYGGAQWATRPRATERRVTFNYARALVRKGVSYLFGEPVRWVTPSAVPGSAEALASAATEAALANVAVANDLGRLDFAVAIDAAVLGDGAFKVTWDAARGGPTISPVDVQGLYCWTEADDYRRLTRVIQTYRVPTAAEHGGAGVPGTTLPRAGLVVEDWTAQRLTIERDGEMVRDGPNPYPWLPFVVFPNEAVPNEFWGVSDLADLMPVCAELNRRLSVLCQILDLSGAPVAVLENVDGSEGITMEPGAKWELPREARAYLLDLLSGGGVQLHVQAIESLYRALHDLAETPRTAFGEGDGALSGVALEVQLQPLIHKVRRKRAIWDGVFQRRNEMVLDLLALHGQEVGTRRTLVVWPPITPRDRPQLVRDEVSLVGAGIHSRQRAAERLGEHDPAAEFATALAEAHSLAAVDHARICQS